MMHDWDCGTGHQHPAMLGRRHLLGGGAGALATLGLSGAARAVARYAAAPAIVPIVATLDRVQRVTVCMRPFRAAGPRIEVEALGDKRIVHHYGHGGSGWSLSWGSAHEAVLLALAGGDRTIAVVGAGAIGMTTAIVAQRMGAKVTIYARERFPEAASSNATGTWSPSSRLAMRAAVSSGFEERWERMARRSYLQHQSYLGLAGAPVEYTDRYELLDTRPGSTKAVDVGLVGFDARLADVSPRPEPVGVQDHPFRAPYVERSPSMTFNVTALYRQLEADFLTAGGTFVPMTFDTPSDVARLRERTVIDCTGYGARALWKDESVEPMRGQISWLLPQAGATYGVHYRSLYLLARRDGIVLFRHGADDLFGYRDFDERPDWNSTRLAVADAASIFATER